MKKLALLFIFILTGCGGLEALKAEGPFTKTNEEFGKAPDWLTHSERTGEIDGKKVIYVIGYGYGKNIQIAKSDAQLHAMTALASSIQSVSINQEKVLNLLTQNILISGLLQVNQWCRQSVSPIIVNGKTNGWNNPIYEYYIQYAYPYDSFRKTILAIYEKEKKLISLSPAKEKLYQALSGELKNLTLPEQTPLIPKSEIDFPLRVVEMMSDEPFWLRGLGEPKTQPDKESVFSAGKGISVYPDIANTYANLYSSISAFLEMKNHLVNYLQKKSDPQYQKDTAELLKTLSSSFQGNLLGLVNSHYWWMKTIQPGKKSLEEEQKWLNPVYQTFKVFQIQKEYYFLSLDLLLRKSVSLLLEDEKGILSSLSGDFNNLMFAAVHELPNLALQAIKNGENLNYKNKKGITPLLYALKNGSLETARILINNNADLNTQDEKGNNVFLLALKSGFTEFLPLLVHKKADINSLDANGANALFIALNFNNKTMDETASFLIGNGIDLSYQDKDGKTALFIALSNKNEKIVRLLLDKGADFNIKMGFGKNPLIYCIENKLENTAKLLIEKGAKISLKDNEENSPLHLAILNQQFNLANLLISKGSTMNEKDKDGKTPLMLAIETKALDTAKLLTEVGADTTLKDKKEKTALDYAKERENQEIIELLTQQKNK